jgi:DNA-binding NtrC family response regulator
MAGKNKDRITRMKTSFLLINGSRDCYWRQELQEALSPLGSVAIAKEREALSRVQQDQYDVIIVDATVVTGAAELASRIRQTRPGARIVIATTSPTWQRAREAYHAGAIDYIRKTLVHEELLATFRDVLRKKPAPWPSGFAGR